MIAYQQGCQSDRTCSRGDGTGCMRRKITFIQLSAFIGRHRISFRCKILISISNASNSPMRGEQGPIQRNHSIVTFYHSFRLMVGWLLALMLALRCYLNHVDTLAAGQKGGSLIFGETEAQWVQPNYHNIFGRSKPRATRSATKVPRHHFLTFTHQALLQVNIDSTHLSHGVADR